MMTCPLFSDAYAAIAIAGGMGEGHIPCSALSEMVRVVTPGEPHGVLSPCIFMKEIDVD